MNARFPCRLRHAPSKSLLQSLPIAALAAALWVAAAQAGIVTQAYRVSGVNFPQSFDWQTVVFDAAPHDPEVIAHNMLRVEERATSLDDGRLWLEFNLSTVGGEPIMGDLFGPWKLFLENVRVEHAMQLQPGVGTGYMAFTADGFPVGMLDPLPGNGVLGPHPTDVAIGGNVPDVWYFPAISDGVARTDFDLQLNYGSFQYINQQIGVTPRIGNYNVNGLRLGVLLEPEGYRGDFDENLVADMVDYHAWSQGFGVAFGATASQGDAYADGTVDGRDFLAWQSNFDGGSGRRGRVRAAAPIPEPLTCWLTLVAAGVAVARRRN